MSHFTITVRNLQQPELRPVRIHARSQWAAIVKLMRIRHRAFQSYERQRDCRLRSIDIDDTTLEYILSRPGMMDARVFSISIDYTPEEEIPDGYLT